MSSYASCPLFPHPPTLNHARMPDRGYTGLLCMDMEWVDDIGSRPAAWCYVPVQSYSCSLIVFYRTLVFGKDTY